MLRFYFPIKWYTAHLISVKTKVCYYELHSRLPSALTRLPSDVLLCQDGIPDPTLRVSWSFRGVAWPRGCAQSGRRFGECSPLELDGLAMMFLHHGVWERRPQKCKVLAATSYRGHLPWEDFEPSPSRTFSYPFHLRNRGPNLNPKQIQIIQ